MDSTVLDTMDPRALGAELQKARTNRRMTQEEAAKVIDVARTTITAIEKGERRLKADELIKLAQAYGRQVSDFVRPRPAIGSFQPLFRAYHTLKEEDRQAIAPFVNELEELARDYVELEQLLQAPLVQRYPPEYVLGRVPPERAAEGVAQEERTRLGLGDGPIARLRDVLEQDIGLRVFYLPLPSKFSGFYCYDAAAGGCIAVSSHHPHDRARWTEAHEYGEFLVERHKVDVLVENGYDRRPVKERFADTFAVHFLMPTTGLTRRFNDIHRAKGTVTPADLLTLAHYYGVSFAAMTRHLESMRLLPTGTWDKLKQSGFKVREAQQQLGLPPQQVDRAMLPRRYRQLATRAFDAGLITEGQLARFLRLGRLQARQMADEVRQEMAEVSDNRVYDLDLTQSVNG